MKLVFRAILMILPFGSSFNSAFVPAVLMISPGKISSPIKMLRLSPELVITWIAVSSSA